MSDAEELISAVKAGDANRVGELLKKDRSLVRATDSDGASAVLKAVYYRRKEVLDLLLGSGVELDIFEASAVGDLERVKELISKDSHLVNAFAPDGFYPLGLAVFFGKKTVAAVLIAAGADVNAVAKNEMRVAPLHAAAAAHQLELATMLVERGADVNARQESDFTPLQEAAATGQVEMIKLFLSHGADVAARNQQGKTALDYAIESGHKEAEEILKARKF